MMADMTSSIEALATGYATRLGIIAVLLLNYSVLTEYYQQHGQLLEIVTALNALGFIRRPNYILILALAQFGVPTTSYVDVMYI